MKTGYSIRTWRMRLFCSEKQMIEATEDLYREAVNFYYELLKDREDLWEENLLAIQGQLEKLTVPGKDGRVPKYIPPGGKLPVYFRRSAMNKAAMAVKTAAGAESFPEKIDANITFFKGMYRDLTDTSVVLKLWNGKKWIWTECSLTGRPFPKEAAILSPSLVHEEKWLMLHVPVKQENSDARTAKERMKKGTRLCSVRFTNTDSFAVCTVLDEQSIPLAVKNCSGGKAYRHHCRELLKKIETSKTYVKDFCQMLYKAIFVDRICGYYNVGTGIGTSLLDQIKGMVDVFGDDGRKSEIIMRPDKPNAPQYIMDIAPAVKELEYEPKYNYLEMLQDFKKEMLLSELKEH